MQLYNLERSGNCYKIRLMLSLLGIDYERIDVNTNAGENRQPAFLALNPRGQVPVLLDGSDAIWDSTAILIYLATRYGQGMWLPEAPLAMARTMQWLAMEQNEGRYGLGRARAIVLKNQTAFAQNGNLAECQALARTALSILDAQLSQSAWLVADIDRPTIADIACYPYAAMAWEGGLDLSPYESLNEWFGRIAALPGYVPLPSVRR